MQSLEFARIGTSMERKGLITFYCEGGSLRFQLARWLLAVN